MIFEIFQEMILCHKKRQAKLHSKQVEIDVVQGLIGVATDRCFMGFRFNKRFVIWKKNVGWELITSTQKWPYNSKTANV